MSVNGSLFLQVYVLFKMKVDIGNIEITAVPDIMLKKFADGGYS